MRCCLLHNCGSRKWSVIYGLSIIENSATKQAIFACWVCVCVLEWIVAELCLHRSPKRERRYPYCTHKRCHISRVPLLPPRAIAKGRTRVKCGLVTVIQCQRRVSSLFGNAQETVKTNTARQQFHLPQSILKHNFKCGVSIG